MPLRKTDFGSTRRFEDGTDWLVLRTHLSKGEADQLKDVTAKYNLDPAAADIKLEIRNCVAEANQALFVILCDSWSLGEVSERAYSDLDEESGEWVDDCIAKVLEERRKRAEKNVGSSKRRAKRVTSLAPAEVSV